MQSPKHVFISFKSEEEKIAEKFKNAINSAGYNVWWAEDLQCGQEWHGEIDKAIEEAGAIVVIWSSKSYTSPWVKHEASQAMAKNNYSPVRIELINIESPFSRIQATDVIDWNGETNHTGFQNLLVRLNQLMPAPVPIWQKWSILIWRNRAVIALSLITLFALSLLVRQSKTLDSQIVKQEEIYKNVNEQSKTLETQGGILQSQIKKQDSIIENGREQSKVMDSQLVQQQEISSNVRGQSEILKSQIKLIDSVEKLQKTNIESQLKAMDMQKASQFPISNLTQDLLFSYPLDSVVHISAERENIKQLVDQMIDKYPRFFHGTAIDIRFSDYISADTIEKFKLYPTLSLEYQFYKMAKPFYSLPYFDFKFYNAPVYVEDAKAIAKCDYNLDYTDSKAQRFISFQQGFIVLHYIYPDFNFNVFDENIHGDTLTHLDQFKTKYLRFGACCFNTKSVTALHERFINVLVCQLKIKNSRHVLWTINKVSQPNASQVFYELNFY